MPSKTKNVPIPAENIAELVSFAVNESIDLVIVGPEQPLVDGITNAMLKNGIPCFGPSKEASIIEASKAWSKDFMSRNGIRTARYSNFSSFEAAKEYIESVDHRVVVKVSCYFLI